MPEKGHIAIFNRETCARKPSRAFLTGCLRRLPLKCLAGLLGHSGIWVFCRINPLLEQEYYLETLIESFADVWGPVWKVLHPHQYDEIAKYNVRGGSIIPVPSYLAIDIAVQSDQSLCRWQSSSGLPEISDNRSINSRKDFFIQKEFLGHDMLVSEGWLTQLTRLTREYHLILCR